MSWLARSQLILALLGLTILVQSVSAGNCSSVEPLKLERDRVWFVVSGGNASAITVFNGAPYGTNSIGWVLDMAVERKKTTVEVGRPEDVQYRCVVPRPDFKNFEAFLRPQLDPLEPRVPGRDCSGYVDPTYPGANDCGEVVAHIRASEFNCWQERAYDSLEGFSRERILVYFSLSDDPLFNMTISYELLDGNLNYTYNHSFGGQHEIQYRKDHLKINYEINGYPWSNLEPTSYSLHSNNASWLSIWWNISTEFDRQSVLSLGNTKEKLSLELVATSGDVSMAFDLLMSFLLDGQKTRDESPSEFSIELPSAPPLNLSWNMALPICRDNVAHFTNFWYDPSFTVLFSGDIPSKEDDTRPAAKNRTTLAIAVGVSVGVVALIAVTLIIVIIKVPAVKDYFRPYARRGRAGRDIPSRGHPETSSSSSKHANSGSAAFVTARPSGAEIGSEKNTFPAVSNSGSSATTSGWTHSSKPL